MRSLGQCSVCGADLSAASSGTPPEASSSTSLSRPAPRLFFAGREHRFCRGTPCLMAFKREPERFAAAGRPATPGDGPPPAAPPRTPRRPSPFTVRSAPQAAPSETPRDG